MLLHLPIVIMATFSPVDVFDAVPKFDMVHGPPHTPRVRMRCQMRHLRPASIGRSSRSIRLQTGTLGRGFAGGARIDGGFGGGHMGSGFPSSLVGGSFAWPYYDYCSRHPADQNC
jgi:hypothetical protein